MPVAEGIFPATHPVSNFFGAEPLDAEESTQVTLGLAALEALGVQGAHAIAQVGFFNNDLDTQTQGVDLVATYAIDSGAGLTEFSVSLNRNRTRVTEISTRTGRDGKGLFDLQAAWRIGDTYSLTLGGLNVFGETPDRAGFEACCGRIYRSDSMISWQGAYYYLRLAADIWTATPAGYAFTDGRSRCSRSES